MKQTLIIYALSFILGMGVGVIMSNLLHEAKRVDNQLNGDIIYPHIYNKADTIQVIVDDKGWQVTHPYKRMGGK